MKTATSLGWLVFALVVGGAGQAPAPPLPSPALAPPPLGASILRAAPAEDGSYNDPDILDGETIQLKVARSYAERTTFDFANEGRGRPVDVIRYLPPTPAHEEMVVGPTLIFRRGITTHVDLSNTLRADEQPVLSAREGCEAGTPPDVWKQDAAEDLFGTNLHTHGLHIQPTGLGDNVFLNIPPQSTRHLAFTLPPDHVAGTFWYHNHRHGAVAYQAVNGMQGALIVPGSPPANPNAAPSASDDLEAIPEVEQSNHIPGVAGNFGRVMLIQQFRFAETERHAADGRPIWVVDPADISDRKIARPEENLGRITAGLKPENPVSHDPEPSNHYVDILGTNGVRAPVITMRRGCVERWRFIDSGMECTVNAQWYKWDGTGFSPVNDGAIRMFEIALDGIPTGYMDETPVLNLCSGARSDMLVQISKKALPGEKYVLFTDRDELPYVRPHEHGQRSRGGTEPLPAMKVPPNAVAVVEIGRDFQVMKLPEPSEFARWKIGEPLEPQVTRKLGFHFVDAEGKAPPVDPHGRSGEFGITETYVQKPYAQTVGAEAISMQLGRAEEWTLSADGGSHPFHLHVNPFQVPDSRYKDRSGNLRWVWRDTVLLNGREDAVKIRVQPRDFTGRSLIHCHTLDHEDQGMMKDINILDADGHESEATYFLEPCFGRDGHTVPAALRPARGKRQVVIVFLGLQCPHCLIEMREVVNAAGRFENAQVLAVSAMPLPPDPGRRLGVAAGVDLRFYTPAEDEKLLDDLGVVGADGLVAHAVLIFDENGKETFRYVGADPLPEISEISRALARMSAAGR